MSEKLRKYRSTIVYWHGGGYDGCIWEPNMGFVDDRCEWHPVVSTGCGKIPDEDTLLEAIEENDAAKDEIRTATGGYRTWDYFSVHPLTQEGADWLQKNVRADYVARLIDRVNECPDVSESLMMKCTHCGKHFSSYDYSYSELVSIATEAGYYRGDGGIGIITDSVFCEDCKYELIDSVHPGDWVYLYCNRYEELREYSGKRYEVKSVSDDGDEYGIIVGEDDDGEDIVVSVPADCCEKIH